MTWSSPGPRRSAPGWRLRAALHRLAAVDHHRGSDDEGSRIRTQPQDGCGDLLRLAGPADWLRRSRARELPLLPLRGAPAEAIHHWRVDDAGANDIDTDVLRGVVEGRRLRQADHTVFRRDVGRLIFEALDPGARRRVHDCAAPKLPQQRNLVLHAQEHAAQIDADDPVPLLLRDIGRRLFRLFNTGVVE